MMNSTITIEARRFPVTTMGPGSREPVTDHIILTKQQLQAAQIVGQSSKELIHRLYSRQGLQIVNIGKAEKKTITIDLENQWKKQEATTA